MKQRRLNWEALLEIDVTPWLIGAVLLLGAVGFFFGVAAAVKTLVIVFVVLFVLAVFVLVFAHDHTEHSQFADLRDHFGGKIQRNWRRLGCRCLRFQHGRATVMVWLNYPHSESFDTTQCRVEINGLDSSVQFEIIPRGLRTLVKRLMGSQAVACDNKSFSEQFGVFGEPVAQVVQLLSVKFQADVRTLENLGLVYIGMSRRRLEIIAGENSLQRIIAAALSLADHASTLRSS